MVQKTENFISDAFSIHVIETRQEKKVTYVRLHADDRFGRRRHALERKAFGVFTGALEAYLRRRPHLDFNHPKNIIRRIVYLPPALKSWAAYMPGGFATFHVHNPDHTHLHNGKKIDYLTRNLFRHSSDAIGLRSRAYAMSWFIYRHFSHRKHIRWLSIASGTGQPTFDAARLFDSSKTFYLADINTQALDFARELARVYGIEDQQLMTINADVTDAKKSELLFNEAQPHITDAMGLFEYLDEPTAIKLLKNIRTHMPTDGVFVFTNMHADHPQLQVHKRGLGWPGVIPRTTGEVLSMVKKAGFLPEHTTVLLPDDNVYAVYGLTKA
jgi:SAM-dependent methyltransferase